MSKLIAAFSLFIAFIITQDHHDQPSSQGLLSRYDGKDILEDYQTAENQTNEANAARFLKCVWSFYDIAK